MISNFMTSLIRTYVPLTVGFALTWLAATLKIVIDPQTELALGGLAVVALTAAYYWLARLLEKRWPALGFLLGKAAQPKYAAKAADGSYDVSSLPAAPPAQP